MRHSPGSRMRREIMQQPEAIAATLAAETDKVRELAQRLREREIRHVLLVARGTSDNAAMYARYAFSIIAAKLTSLTATSLLTVYDVDLDLRDTLVVGISQSGESAGTLEFIQQAREKGAMTVAVTNTARSPLTQAAEHFLCTRAKEEKSVPATKTYTTALAVLHQLAALWGGDVHRASQIMQAPDWIAEVLKLEAEIQARAERYRYMSSCAVMGRGYSLCTALEVAQKLAQCCYVVPAAYSGADFLHGPVSSIDHGFPCFVFAPKGNSLQSMSELLTALEEREAETIVVSNSAPLLDRATVGFRIPDMPEEFAPLASVVVGQLFALNLAVYRHIDPDQPRGVSKVTFTL